MLSGQLTCRTCELPIKIRERFPAQEHSAQVVTSQAGALCQLGRQAIATDRDGAQLDARRRRRGRLVGVGGLAVAPCRGEYVRVCHVARVSAERRPLQAPRRLSHDSSHPRRVARRHHLRTGLPKISYLAPGTRVASSRPHDREPLLAGGAIGDLRERDHRQRATTATATHSGTAVRVSDLRPPRCRARRAPRGLEPRLRASIRRGGAAIKPLRGCRTVQAASLEMERSPGAIRSRFDIIADSGRAAEAGWLVHRTRPVPRRRLRARLDR
jgi:hypothetical protein